MNSITESLASLSAELTRRERVLAAAGAKDIEQYAERGSRQPRYRPLPPAEPGLVVPIRRPGASARPLAGIIRPGVDIKIPYEWS